MDSRLHVETVENRVADDVLYLIHLINRIENIVSRTPFGNTESFTTDCLVKQGASLALFTGWPVCKQ